MLNSKNTGRRPTDPHSVRERSSSSMLAEKNLFDAGATLSADTEAATSPAPPPSRNRWLPIKGVACGGDAISWDSKGLCNLVECSALGTVRQHEGRHRRARSAAKREPREGAKSAFGTETSGIRAPYSVF